jgi:sugar-specific transcriptional regulator TrmB
LGKDERIISNEEVMLLKEARLAQEEADRCFEEIDKLIENNFKIIQKMKECIFKIENGLYLNGGGNEELDRLYNKSLKQKNKTDLLIIQAKEAQDKVRRARLALDCLINKN